MLIRLPLRRYTQKSEKSQPLSCGLGRKAKSRTTLSFSRLLMGASDWWTYNTELALMNIRIKSSDQCSFCTEVDSILHFFCKCPTVSSFWVDLSHWCANHLDLHLHRLTESEILLGATRKITGLKVINWLILCAKFFIQKRKLFHNANISLISFLAEVRLKLFTERQACLWENKPQKFRVWKRIFDVLG